MKLISATVENFGSYKSLTFDYTDKGLALVYGPTGAGKSTLLDIAPWVLYGTTAKDGSVDDVRNWGSSDPTYGSIRLSVSGVFYTITRVRGSSKQNDLFWFADGERENRRGKDITDTQKLLEGVLGCTAEQFLTASYFHEFSKVGTFFTAKAKDRRQVFEEIADLSLASRIGLAASERRKVASKHISEANTAKSKAEGSLEQLEASYEATKRHEADWQSERENKLIDLERRSTTFEKDKIYKVLTLETEAREWEAVKDKAVTKLVDSLTAMEAELKEPSVYEEALKEIDRGIKAAKSGSRCSACQQTKRDETLLEGLEQQRRSTISEQMKNERLRGKFDADRNSLEAEYAKVNPYPEQIVAAEAVENHLAAQADELRRQSNPFTTQVEKSLEAFRIGKHLLGTCELSVKSFERSFSRLSQVADLAGDLRGELLRKTIRDVEGDTNAYLLTHFDAEITVHFEPVGDALEVSLFKNGFDCNFKQLSKGQRQLLRLTFVLAVQKAAANKAGVHFDTLAFDEALDGLDGELKVKAFGLFESLAKDHTTVLMVDHNESFQNLFSTRCRVSLNEDASHIEVENE